LNLERSFLPIGLVFDIGLEDQLALFRERVDDNCERSGDQPMDDQPSSDWWLTIKHRHIIASVLSQEHQHLVTELD